MYWLTHAYVTGLPNMKQIAASMHASMLAQHT